MKNNETFHSTFVSRNGRVYNIFTEMVGEDRGEEFYAANPTWRRPELRYNIYEGGLFVNWVTHPSYVAEIVGYREYPGSSANVGSRFD